MWPCKVASVTKHHDKPHHSASKPKSHKAVGLMTWTKIAHFDDYGPKRVMDAIF